MRFRDKRYLNQNSPHSCGPYALHNALLLYDTVVAPRRLAKLAKTTKKDGTNEGGLSDAGEALGFRLKHHCCYTPDFTKETLRWYLRNKVPVLLCVEFWQHWVTAIRCTTRHIWIADSSRDGLPVLRRLTWRQLLSRMAVWQGPGDVRWDVYALTRVSGVL